MIKDQGFKFGGRSSIRWSLFLLAILITFAGLLPATKQVEAATNGRQIKVVLKNGFNGSWQVTMNNLYIRGTNQRGEFIPWSSPQWNPPRTEFQLNNWWWKGPTYIKLNLNLSRNTKVNRECWVDISSWGTSTQTVNYDVKSGKCS